MGAIPNIPVAAATGWAAAAVLAAALLVAALNLVRRRARVPVRPAWLRAHSWLGTAAAVTGSGHCLVSISPARLPLGPELGSWAAAAAAAALLVATGVIGAMLTGVPRTARARLRRNHLVAMAATIGVGAVHAALNGPLRPP